MKHNNDLMWVIDNGENEIDYYLENVTSEQFAKDVREILKKSIDKELVKNIINDLNKYL